MVEARLRPCVLHSRSRRVRDHEKRLEAENEHLLKRIIAQKSRVAEYVVSNPPRSHVASSSINRKRQQKYIHAQNLVSLTVDPGSRHLGTQHSMESTYRASRTKARVLS